MINKIWRVDWRVTKNTIIGFTAGILALALGATIVQPALAHERVEVGPYVLIIGWLNEPVVVGERNAIWVEVTLDGEPVEGLEATLAAEVLYGGRTLIGNLSPTADPGIYTAELIPTVRGQYELHLSGAIGDEQLDLVVQPEEVLSARTLQFPEAVAEVRDLEVALQDLEARVSAANVLAAVGIGLGAVAIVISIIVMRRKSTP